MRFLVVLILSNVLLPMNGFAQAYSLEACLTAATKNNITLQQSRNNLEATGIDKKSAIYNLFPAANFNAEHIFAGGKNIDPVTNTFIKDEFSGGELDMNFQLNIFSGFSTINSIKASVYKLQAAKYAYKKTELEIFSAITIAYAKVMYSGEQITTIKMNNLNTKKELEVIQEKINVGKLSKSDYYAINTRYKSEQADLAAAQNDSLTAMNELKYSIGIAMNESFDIINIDSKEIDMILYKNMVYETLLTKILHGHPAFLEVMLNEKTAQSNLKIAKGSLFPTISLAGNLFSNYNLNETNLSGSHIPFNNQFNNNFGKSIGIYAQIPLFTKFKNRYAVGKEKINLTNAKLEISRVENELEKNIQQLINDFVTAKRKYILQAEALQQGELSYTAFEERHKLGFISSLELITAKDQLRAVQLKTTQAKYDLYFKYKLIELLLNMSESD